MKKTMILAALAAAAYATPALADFFKAQARVA